MPTTLQIADELRLAIIRQAFPIAGVAGQDGGGSALKDWRDKEGYDLPLCAKAVSGILTASDTQLVVASILDCEKSHNRNKALANLLLSGRMFSEDQCRLVFEKVIGDVESANKLPGLYAKRVSLLPSPDGQLTSSEQKSFFAAHDKYFQERDSTFYGAQVLINISAQSDALDSYQKHRINLALDIPECKEIVKDKTELTYSSDQIEQSYINEDLDEIMKGCNINSMGIKDSIKDAQSTIAHLGKKRDQILKSGKSYSDILADFSAYARNHIPMGAIHIREDVHRPNTRPNAGERTHARVG